MPTEDEHILHILGEAIEPHICVLHDVGSQDGTSYLVMEYVEGKLLMPAYTKLRCP